MDGSQKSKDEEENSREDNSEERGADGGGEREDNDQNSGLDPGSLCLLDRCLMQYEPVDLEIVYQFIVPVSSGFFVNSIAIFLLVISRDINIIYFSVFFYTLLEMLKSILLITGNMASRYQSFLVF